VCEDLQDLAFIQKKKGKQERKKERKKEKRKLIESQDIPK